MTLLLIGPLGGLGRVLLRVEPLRALGLASHKDRLTGTLRAKPVRS
ncbi:MAG: hypothetical protein U0401_30405 [Anaerolineae bacterium]